MLEMGQVFVLELMSPELFQSLLNSNSEYFVHSQFLTYFLNLNQFLKIIYFKIPNLELMHYLMMRDTMRYTH